MDWRKIAPWNWFKDEEAGTPARTPARIEPDDPFLALRSQMDRFFDDIAERFHAGMPALPRMASPLRPQVDISEGRKAYKVRADLPGLEPDDISISVDGQRLSIRGEKRRESEEEDEGYHCVERSYGMVQRVLSLPDDADADDIAAKFKNGVLELHIPKRASAASRGRSIEIQRG